MNRDTKLIAILRRQYRIILTALGEYIFVVLGSIKQKQKQTNKLYLTRVTLNSEITDKPVALGNRPRCATPPNTEYIFSQLAVNIYILLTKREGCSGRISVRGLDSTDRA